MTKGKFCVIIQVRKLGSTKFTTQRKEQKMGNKEINEQTYKEASGKSVLLLEEDPSYGWFLLPVIGWYTWFIQRWSNRKELEMIANTDPDTYRRDWYNRLIKMAKYSRNEFTLNPTQRQFIREYEEAIA